MQQMTKFPRCYSIVLSSSWCKKMKSEEISKMTIEIAPSANSSRENYERVHTCNGWRKATAQNECAPRLWNVPIMATRACFTFNGISVPLSALLMLIVCNKNVKYQLKQTISKQIDFESAHRFICVCVYVVREWVNRLKSTIFMRTKFTYYIHFNFKTLMSTLTSW